MLDLYNNQYSRQILKDNKEILEYNNYISKYECIAPMSKYYAKYLENTNNKKTYKQNIEQLTNKCIENIDKINVKIEIQKDYCSECKAMSITPYQLEFTNYKNTLRKFYHYL